MTLDKSDPFPELGEKRQLKTEAALPEKRPYEWMTPGVDHEDVLERLLTRLSSARVRAAVRLIKDRGDWNKLFSVLPPKGQMEDRVRKALHEIFEVYKAGGDPNLMETANPGGRPGSGEPWVKLGISRSLYFERKKAGLL